jgi:ABC-type lipoprotein export system ATPase subunit
VIQSSVWGKSNRHWLLVFAIFHEPGPVLLAGRGRRAADDANTERYAKLVTSMSKGTQFLFISHNKIAMEMAEQLCTMQEQGVSRYRCGGQLLSFVAAQA